jgi:hypothetical protein
MHAVLDDCVVGTTILVTDHGIHNVDQGIVILKNYFFHVSSGAMAHMDDGEDVVGSQRYPYEVDYDSLDRAREDDLDFHALSEFLNEMVKIHFLFFFAFPFFSSTCCAEHVTLLSCACH